jgi:hypothetical protein
MCIKGREGKGREGKIAPQLVKQHAGSQSNALQGNFIKRR